MYADQPDHMADRTVTFNGNVVKVKFARKGDNVRNEIHPFDLSDRIKDESYRFYRIVLISKVNGPTMALDPQEKTYAEAPENFKLVSFNIDEVFKNLTAEVDQLQAQRIGTEIIEGHKSTKVRLRFVGDATEDPDEEIYFYFAQDLKNLFLKMDASKVKQLSGSYTVSNVSLDVLDDLFKIPEDYRKVDFDSMLAVIKRKALK
jgi:hypothetical protein